MFMRSGFRRRTALRWLALFGTSVATAVCSGGGTEETCLVSSVTVQPNQVTLTVGSSTTLTAQVTSSNCGTQPGVTWTSSNPSLVSILANGDQAQITGEALTQIIGDLAAAHAPVTISASAGAPAQTGTSLVTVVPLPEIALSANALTFNATQGGANPASQDVAITNSGGGTLSGLGVGTITYGVGATGWLQPPALSSTTANPSAILTIQPVTGALPAGVYTATVPVTSGVASNSPQNVTVTFTVTAPPEIALSTTTLDYTATGGGANPASQAVTITNNGGGTLSGLGVGTITYGPGATGWLQAPTFSSTTADPTATLTIQPVTAALAAGVYTATVPVTSGVASNSPQNVTVTFTVIAPDPQIALSANALSFNATQGGANPASQDVAITNSGGGTLSGLGVGTITYGAGATGWLQAPTLSSTTANPTATLTLQPVTGGLAPGSYTAIVPVTSGVASNSPQNVTVTFTVTAPPQIVLSANALNFTAIAGGANPASQAVTISNGGDGTLSGLAVGTITYGPGATDWLQAPTLSSTTADPTATLTIQPVTGALAAGNYTATVPVVSAVASNSPQDVTVTFVVGAGAVTAFLGNNQTGLVGFALNVRPAVRVTDGGGGPVANQSVTFNVTSGSGSATGTTVNTNSNGVAQVGDWVLGGAPGANTLTATVAGTGITGNPVDFTATGVAGSYNVTVQNVGPPLSAAVQSAFNSAAAKWQQIIYQDITDFPNFSAGAGQCGTNSPAIGPVTVDDVLIFARIDAIDGAGGVLGSAGPCFIRSNSRLTLLGQMTFDVVDVDGLIAAGSLGDVILHEMGHVLGFGTLWTQAQFNCLQDPSFPPGIILDTHFSCANGRAMFDSIGGTTYTGGNKVPVENCGPASPFGCGAGNVNAHWREPTFDNELMTGFLQPGTSNPLSRLSAAAMEDLGYGVNYAGSDQYLHTFTLRAGASQQPMLDLGDDLYRGPIYVVDRSGRVTGVIQPR